MSKASKPRLPETGTLFPDDGKSKSPGSRSTTFANVGAIGSALAQTMHPRKTAFETELAADTKQWRHKYVRSYINLVKASSWSPDNCVDMSRAGIRWMQENFGFKSEVDAKETTFAHEMERAHTMRESFHVGSVQGEGALDTAFSLPYRGATLRGQALVDQLNKWAALGTTEQDAMDAIKLVAADSQGLDLRDHTFVLIGAGSAMGPFEHLLRWGATVVAIDIPGAWGKGSKRPVSGLWERLIKTARQSPGRLVFPLSKPQAKCVTDLELYEAAGCDLTKQPAELLHWLLKPEVGNNTRPLVIGNYTYLDSGMHVLLSLCADALIEGLTKARQELGAEDTAIAFLCTPTDCHVISKLCDQAQERNAGFSATKPIELAFKMMTLGTQLVSNRRTPMDTKDGTKMYRCDALINAQGPNYALAKRLQHWRAVVAFTDGFTVSSNVAPSTVTLSVISNRTFKWVYEGWPFVKPMEAFPQETTNTLMAALLAADVNTKSSKLKSASPARPENRGNHGIINPLEIFRTRQIHGGMYQCAYESESIGALCILVRFFGGSTFFAPFVYMLWAAVVGVLVHLNQESIIQLLSPN